MASFTVAILEHEYASVEIERQIVEQGGGRLLDTDPLPVALANPEVLHKLGRFNEC